jgi:hypothetical protein
MRITIFFLLFSAIVFVGIPVYTQALDLDSEPFSSLLTTVCPEGFFLESAAPGATCTSCKDFRADPIQYACWHKDSNHCCGSEGCGTYVANAIGSSACFERSVSMSINVAAPSVIGVFLLLTLLGSCCMVCKDEQSDCTPEFRIAFLHMATLLGTLTNVLTLVVVLAYPVQLRADYSAVTSTQTVLLTCIPPFVVQAVCAMLAIGYSYYNKRLHGCAINLAGCTTSLLSLAAFFTVVRHRNDLVPLMSADGKTIQTHLELDSQYQAWGLLVFACLVHSLLWLVCAYRLLVAGIVTCMRSHSIDQQITIDGRSYTALVPPSNPYASAAHKV